MSFELPWTCGTCGASGDLAHQDGECLTCLDRLLKAKERAWRKSLTLVEQAILSLHGRPVDGWSRSWDEVTLVDILASLA
jgi:hypothetical protein